MPIKSENRHRYPPNWKSEIRPRILERASGRCECLGECGLSHGDAERCRAQHGAFYACRSASRGWMQGHVVLTIAHLDHALDDHGDENLKAMCQGCHLRFDGRQHARAAAATRRARKAYAELFVD